MRSYFLGRAHVSLSLWGDRKQAEMVDRAAQKLQITAFTKSLYMKEIFSRMSSVGVSVHQILILGVTIWFRIDARYKKISDSELIPDSVYEGV